MMKLKKKKKKKIAFQNGTDYIPLFEVDFLVSESKCYWIFLLLSCFPLRDSKCLSLKKKKKKKREEQFLYTATSCSYLTPR